MKAVLPISFALLLQVSSSPVTLAADQSSVPKVCLDVRNIQRTETPDDRTILFHMRNGKIWQNRLRQNCPSLRYSPFTQQLHTDQICSNQQFIHVALTGDNCALGTSRPQSQNAEFDVYPHVEENMKAKQLFAWTATTTGLLLAAHMGVQAQPATEQKGSVPDLSSNHMTWVLMNGTAYFKVPGDGGPGPIMQAGKEYKHDEVARIADTSNPILQPWAKKLMDEENAKVLAGGIPYYPTSRCWPGGVPGLLLFPGEPVVFAQTPNEVWILYQRDAQVRRVYLNVPHSKKPSYSWYGESVGHYENGNTLVVDTVGLADKGKRGPIDRFRTPHTNQLHVIERYHLNNGGKNIEVSFTVEDPGTFTMPWNAKVDFQRGSGARSGDWSESICADGPVDYFADDKPGAVPIPKADKPDF